jgi:CheY-like chemotaxis protein
VPSKASEREPGGLLDFGPIGRGRALTRILVYGQRESQVLELVVDALGQFGADVPAAAFTGWTDVEDQRNARRAGFHVHLSKPVDLGKLAEVVALLSQKQSGGAADHVIHRDPRGIAS